LYENLDPLEKIVVPILLEKIYYEQGESITNSKGREFRRRHRLPENRIQGTDTTAPRVEQISKIGTR